MPFVGWDTQRKTKWRQKFAWWPTRSATGKAIWLSPYYLKTIEIVRGNSDTIESIGTVYTYNEFLKYVLVRA
jgi:hypothetical protein